MNGVSEPPDPPGLRGLTVGPLTDADRTAWEPLARGYKAFYETEVSDAGYEAAWQRLRAGEPMLGLGAWLPDGPDQPQRLVGIAHALFHASAWSDGALYLQDLFVDPTVRGRGVAAALIEHLAQIARERGVDRYHWLTHETNARARRLYDRVASHRGFIRYDHPLTPPA